MNFRREKGPFTWGFLSRYGADEGSVESALTLIPLMILFLTVAQIGVSAYSRTALDQSTQGAVAYGAMGAVRNSSESQNFPWSSAPFALPLPGGGSVLVGQRKIQLPGITPLLVGGDLFSSTGIAIQE
jgi:hypothetical protein